MENRIQPSFEHITEHDLSGSAKEEIIDNLLTENLLGLKRIDELIWRLKAEADNPAVKWKAIRELMRELWPIRKEILIELLPTLLNS